MNIFFLFLFPTMALKNLKFFNILIVEVGKKKLPRNFALQPLRHTAPPSFRADRQ
jgi:hypothetical protein